MDGGILPKKKKEVLQTESTIGIQTLEINRLNRLNKVEISVWDFAGQLEYANNHQVQVMQAVSDI